ncbi:hypothetical protein LguiA_031833 [Lonicera macranthoides]
MANGGQHDFENRIESDRVDTRLTTYLANLSRSSNYVRVIGIYFYSKSFIIPK